MRRCKTCRLWEPKEEDPAASEGFCGYNPPPVLRYVYGLAHAEPSTRIHWESQLAGPFVVRSDFGCSEHQPKTV